MPPSSAVTLKFTLTSELWLLTNNVNFINEITQLFSAFLDNIFQYTRVWFSRQVKHANGRPRGISSSCRCLAQLFAGGGFNATTSLFVSSSSDVVDVRHWSLGHVTFRAETARNAEVECVAATANAVVHAFIGFFGKSSSKPWYLTEVNCAVEWVVAHFPLVQVLHLLPVESVGTGKHRHHQQQEFHRGHGDWWNLQTNWIQFNSIKINNCKNVKFVQVLTWISQLGYWIERWWLSTRIYTNECDTIERWSLSASGYVVCAISLHLRIQCPRESVE